MGSLRRPAFASHFFPCRAAFWYSLVGGQTMKLALRISALTVFLGLGGVLFAQFQRFNRGDDPRYVTGTEDRAEFGWSRLRYSTNTNYGGDFFGYSRGTWQTDYPKADRQFLIAFKRLTRINAKSFEQVVDLDSDDIFNWPFVYAVQVQSWTFTPAQALRMREYLLKGGFLMVDDFHGEADWQSFLRGMRMVFPDRPIEDLKNEDEIFHVIFDLGERFQVPGEQYVSHGPDLRKGRLRSEVASDSRRPGTHHRGHLRTTCTSATPGSGPTIRVIPERFASMAFRLGIDYIMYSMTH